MRLRLREEQGFGLIELTMAMVVLNIGILAIVAAFDSGAVALRRSSHISTASAVADKQLELYRGLVYAEIGFDPTQATGLDNTYTCDSALGASCPNTVTGCATTSTCTDGTVATYAACVSAEPQCQPTRTITGATSPDGYPYRIDSYIIYSTPTDGRQLKKIYVVVRDGNNTAYTFARVSSTFDQVVNS